MKTPDETNKWYHTELKKLYAMALKDNNMASASHFLDKLRNIELFISRPAGKENDVPCESGI